MLNVDDNITSKKKSISHILLFLLVFLAGFLNSTEYLNFMGLNIISSLVSLLFYVLLFLMCFMVIIKNLALKKRISLKSFPYWLVLVVGIYLKFFILFIQKPASIFPGGEHFLLLVTFGTNTIILILLISIIDNLKKVKVSIYALGLGLVFSAIIPLVFYPEMIGLRRTMVQGYEFVGAFWNSPVISYISVGWILVSLSTIEKSSFKRNLLIIIFLLLVFGGLAGLSRAILLSLLVSLLVYLILSKKLTKQLKIILYVPLILLLLLYLFPDLVSNINERIDGGIDIKEEARIDIWGDYLENIPEYFVFGAIDGEFKKYSSAGHAPHSVILNYWVRFGLISLIGFIVLIIGILKSIGIIKRHTSSLTSAALYAWLVAYLSVALINETGFSQLTVFVAFGILLGWGKSYGEELNKKYEVSNQH